MALGLQMPFALVHCAHLGESFSQELRALQAGAVQVL